MVDLEITTFRLGRLEMTIRLVATSIFAPLIASIAFSQEAKPDPREELKTAIPAAIELLENKEYESFIKRFVPPIDLERILKKVTIEDFAKKFGERKSDLLLKVLNIIKDAKPKLDPDGEKATFALKEPIGGKQSMTFLKVGKYWYLGN